MSHVGKRRRGVVGSRHLVVWFKVLGNPGILVLSEIQRIRDWLWSEKVLTPLTHPI